MGSYHLTTQKIFLRILKKGLAFFNRLCYYIGALRETAQKTKYPGVAKFGIALEWGSRGRGFESRHSDQNGVKLRFYPVFFFLFCCDNFIKFVAIA